MRLSPVRSIVAVVVLLLPMMLLYRWQMPQVAPQTRQAIGSLNGQARLLPEGAGDWQTVTAHALSVADRVQAVENVRLVFFEGTTLALEPGADVVVRQARLEDGTLVLYHEAGRLHVDTNNPLFRLEGPAVALTVERARFRVETTAAGDTLVTAERGLVYSRSNGEMLAVAAGESMRSGVGERARVPSATPIALPPPPPPPPRTPTPTATPVPPTQPPQRVHIITQGDTLTYIASKYNVTVDAIIKVKSIKDPNLLSIGQKLIIPPSTPQ